MTRKHQNSWTHERIIQSFFWSIWTDSMKITIWSQIRHRFSQNQLGLKKLLSGRTLILSLFFYEFMHVWVRSGSGRVQILGPRGDLCSVLPWWDLFISRVFGSLLEHPRAFQKTLHWEHCRHDRVLCRTIKVKWNFDQSVKSFRFYMLIYFIFQWLIVSHLTNMLQIFSSFFFFFCCCCF